MINKEAFKERYSDFDKDIVLDILDMFIVGYDEYIAALSTHLSNSDLASLKKAAHAFKGIIGNIEANCTVFGEIDRIETMSEQLLELDKIEDIENDEEYKQALNEIAAQLTHFKLSCYLLLDEAKKLKLEYQE
jgi:HPt (histidine-containing phosphotransfer) domain-containing protein